MKLSFFLVAASYFLFGSTAFLNADTNNDDESNQIVSDADVASDLNELVAVFRDIHPNPFWSKSEEEIRQQVNREVEKVRRSPISQREFVRVAAKLVVLFDDPHCWLLPPGYEAYRDRGGPMLPLMVRFDGIRSTILFAPSEFAIPVPSMLKSINGEPISSLVAEFRPLTGQADDPFGDEFLATFFRRYLWYFRGWSERFEIGYEFEGKESMVVVNGLSNEDYLMALKNADREASLSLRELDDKTALIEFRGCDTETETRKLCDEIFDKVAATGIERIVIDTRDNTGGGDDAWRILLEYLTATPYSGYSSTKYRTSQRLKEILGRSEFEMGYGTDAWAAPIGTEFSIDRGPTDLIVPAPNPKKFKGRWVVMAGRRTFSSGMSFVCAVKAFHLAPIVGMETGGRVKGFGQSVPFTLPRTGCKVYLSTKQFVGSVDVPFRRGVPPDRTVEKPMAILPNSENDPVLQAAILELKN